MSSIIRQDIFWCTADIGWITGHSYSFMSIIEWATTVIFEGVPSILILVVFGKLSKT
jgi:acyl-coenzyme A synthetase/AMP-(fatty) acid ligase